MYHVRLPTLSVDTAVDTPPEVILRLSFPGEHSNTWEQTDGQSPEELTTCESTVFIKYLQKLSVPLNQLPNYSEVPFSLQSVHVCCTLNLVEDEAQQQAERNNRPSHKCSISTKCLLNLLRPAQLVRPEDVCSGNLAPALTNT